MRTIKFLSVFLFLTVFVNSNTGMPAPKFDVKKDLVSKILKEDQKLNADDHDSDSPHKRKRRPRGIEVDVPQINDISFEQPFIYRSFTQIRIEDTFTSFLYCVDLKRGPPLA